MTIQLPQMPKRPAADPKADCCKKAESDLDELLIEWLKRHPDLTWAEAVRCMAVMIASFAQHPVRQERYCSEKQMVRFGDELFRFESFERWVNKASSWFSNLSHGTEYICIDSIGRICKIGKHFMRARDEKTFPIVVYSID